jgi:hypothetical protein
MVIIVKITINVDDDLWRLFSLIVMREWGREKRNEVIVELIKDYVERSGLPTNEKQLEYILQIEEEKKVFLKIKDKLAKDPQYDGKYVAVFKGAIMRCDDDKGRLTENVYKKYGYVPIYIDKVAPGERVVEAPSP